MLSLLWCERNHKAEVLLIFHKNFNFPLFYTKSQSSQTNLNNHCYFLEPESSTVTVTVSVRTMLVALADPRRTARDGSPLSNWTSWSNFCYFGIFSKTLVNSLWHWQVLVIQTCILVTYTHTGRARLIRTRLIRSST